MIRKFSHNSLLFVGDIHGDWNILKNLCLQVSNTLIIQVGDVGLGFHSKTSETWKLKSLNKICSTADNQIVLMRGNHDSKQRFSRLRLENDFNRVLLAQDYEIISWKDKTLQFVGGAISIDRCGREIDKSYWSDEGILLKEDLCQKVDILVTHTCPSFCFPQKVNAMVLGWAQHEKERFGVDLLKELQEERQKLDKIFEICQPTLHVYGHFHMSHDEIISDCRHRLMDINETWEYRS